MVPPPAGPAGGLVCRHGRGRRRRPPVRPPGHRPRHGRAHEHDPHGGLGERSGHGRSGRGRRPASRRNRPREDGRGRPPRRRHPGPHPRWCLRVPGPDARSRDGRWPAASRRHRPGRTSDVPAGRGRPHLRGLRLARRERPMVAGAGNGPLPAASHRQRQRLGRRARPRHRAAARSGRASTPPVRRAGRHRDRERPGPTRAVRCVHGDARVPGRAVRGLHRRARGRWGHRREHLGHGERHPQAGLCPRARRRPAGGARRRRRDGDHVRSLLRRHPGRGRRARARHRRAEDRHGADRRRRHHGRAGDDAVPRPARLAVVRDVAPGQSDPARRGPDLRRRPAHGVPLHRRARGAGVARGDDAAGVRPPRGRRIRAVSDGWWWHRPAAVGDRPVRPATRWRRGPRRAHRAGHDPPPGGHRLRLHHQADGAPLPVLVHAGPPRHEDGANGGRRDVPAHPHGDRWRRPDVRDPGSLRGRAGDRDRRPRLRRPAARRPRRRAAAPRPAARPGRRAPPLLGGRARRVRVPGRPPLAGGGSVPVPHRAARNPDGPRVRRPAIHDPIRRRRRAVAHDPGRPLHRPCLRAGVLPCLVRRGRPATARGARARSRAVRTGRHGGARGPRDDAGWPPGRGLGRPPGGRREAVRRRWGAADRRAVRAVRAGGLGSARRGVVASAADDPGRGR